MNHQMYYLLARVRNYIITLKEPGEIFAEQLLADIDAALKDWIWETAKNESLEPGAVKNLDQMNAPKEGNES